MFRVIFLALFLFTSSSAFALSCAPLEMNQQAIDNADAIFIGKVDSVGEKAGDKMMEPTLYQFTVTKAYKGAVEGDTVTVGRVAYWGDAFAQGESYVIFAKKNQNDVLTADLCGLSQAEGGAENLKAFLESQNQQKHQ